MAPLDEETVHFDPEADEFVVRTCLRLWMESLGYTKRVADANLLEAAQEVTRETGLPIPTLGKQILRDGKTGQPYDQPVTVGVIAILKLHHLVQDKVHARSTGPYTLVPPHPLP